MAKTTKASCHQGRINKRTGEAYNPNHDTLEEVRKEQPHIDAERFEYNRYLQVSPKGTLKEYKGGSGGFNATKHEKTIQHALYAKGLDARNERYIHEGHSKSTRTFESLITDKKTAPAELIFQIGNKDSDIPFKERANKLTAAFNDFYGQLQRDERERAKARAANGQGNYRNLIPLDISLHMDESSPHIHFRFTMAAKDAYGYLMPNQTKALEEMGFQRPDLTKPKSRYNNALIAFSDEMRERFYQCCERQGLTIDREVQNPSRRQEEINEYKLRKAHEELDTLQQAKTIITEELVQARQEATEARVKAQEAREAVEQAQTNIQTLDRQKTALEGRVKVVEAQNQQLSSENMQLKQENRQLQQENRQMQQENRQMQQESGQLSAEIGRLNRELKQAQEQTQKANQERANAVAKLEQIQSYEKGLYVAHQGRQIKRLEILPAEPEKRGFGGKVKAEAQPERAIVATEDLERLENAAAYKVSVVYNTDTIRDIDAKLSQNDIITEQQKLIQEQQQQITTLTVERNRAQRKQQIAEKKVQEHEQYLKEKGLTADYKGPTHSRTLG